MLCIEDGDEYNTNDNNIMIMLITKSCGNDYNNYCDNDDIITHNDDINYPNCEHINY